MITNVIIIGPLIHCKKNKELIIHENAAVWIQDGKIKSIEFDNLNLNNTNAVLRLFSSIFRSLGFSPNENQPRIKRLKPGQFIIPGFIDAHVHAVQFPNLGIGYDKPLLDWLDTYTIPLEKQFNDDDFANQVFDAVVKKTLNLGTTTACYFASIHNKASIILAKKVAAHGQRAFIGKVNMNCTSKHDYTEDTETSITDTKNFINSVNNIKNPLVKPIITPRFAVSCDMDLMKKLGQLAEEFDLHVQTHISENQEEIKYVESVFNDYSSYAAVYDGAGLLTKKTVLAHGVHLSDKELEIIKRRESAVIHCPSSNTLLKSGVCDVRRLIDNNIKVGLGTDVSGGNSSSILDAMRSALEASIHLSFSKQNYTPLNYKEVFYLATLGGAQALDLDDKIGNFEIDKEFDALVIDLNSPNSNLDNFKDYSLDEKLQRFIYSGDDRNIVEVYVAGKNVKKAC